MSLGATRSTPARACSTAIAVEHSYRAIVFHIIARRIENTVVSVRRIRIECDISHDRQFRHRFLHRPNRSQNQAVFRQCRRAFIIFQPRFEFGKQSATASTPSFISARHSFTRSVTFNRMTPGMDAIVSGALSPSTTKSGAMKSAGRRTVSSTSYPQIPQCDASRRGRWVRSNLNDSTWDELTDRQDGSRSDSQPIRQRSLNLHPPHILSSPTNKSVALSQVMFSRLTRVR